METLQWTTTHDTAKRTMCHIFKYGRVMVLTDLNSGQAHVQKDGTSLFVIDVSEMNLESYTCELVKLDKADQRLGGFMLD